MADYHTFVCHVLPLLSQNERLRLACLSRGVRQLVYKAVRSIPIRRLSTARDVASFPRLCVVWLPAAYSLSEEVSDALRQRTELEFRWRDRPTRTTDMWATGVTGVTGETGSCTDFSVRTNTNEAAKRSELATEERSLVRSRRQRMRSMRQTRPSIPTARWGRR